MSAVRRRPAAAAVTVRAAGRAHTFAGPTPPLADDPRFSATAGHARAAPRPAPASRHSVTLAGGRNRTTDGREDSRYNCSGAAVRDARGLAARASGGACAFAVGAATARDVPGAKRQQNLPGRWSRGWCDFSSVAFACLLKVVSLGPIFDPASGSTLSTRASRSAHARLARCALRLPLPARCAAYSTHQQCDLALALANGEADARRAAAALNRTKYNRQSDVRCAQIVVAHLPFDVTIKELSAYFSVFGEVVHVRLPKQRRDKPPCRHVVVTFARAESAEKAAAETDGKKWRHQVLYVRVVGDRSRRSSADEVTEQSTVRVVNLSPWATAENLQQFLSRFGKVDEVVLPADPADGSSYGYALVRFVRPEDADAAVREATGCAFLGRPVIVTRSRRYPFEGDARAGEREAAAGVYEEVAPTGSAAAAAEVRSVYVSNLPRTAEAENVGDHFRQFGRVTAVYRPLSKLDGLPVGYGFVDFSTPEEAQAAVEKADATEFDGRTIRVQLEKTKTAAAGDGYGRRPPSTAGEAGPREDWTAHGAAGDSGCG